MRIAAMGDIHSNHIALEACMRWVYQNDIDGIAFLGDYVSDCPYPQKTMQSARRIISRFKEQNGTVICKELKGIADGVVRRECIDCVKDAALFLEDELK